MFLVADCRVDAVSWDTLVDGDLACAQAKYHARSSETFAFNLFRLSLSPPIALAVPRVFKFLWTRNRAAGS